MVLILELPVALDMCVVPEWDIKAVAEPEEDLVLEAELLEAKEEAEAKLELVAADNLDAKVTAVEVKAGAEETTKKLKPILVQKV